MTLRLLSILFALMFISSCIQEDPIEIAPPYDHSLEKYFGPWEFTYTTHTESWVYVPNGPNGEMVPELQTSESSLVTIGEVSMGTQMGELYIVWDNVTGGGYYGQVLNEEGHLKYNFGNQNLEQLPLNGYHHINDSSYRFDLIQEATYHIDMTGVPLY